MKNKTTTSNRVTTCLAMIALLAASSAQAETVFLTNDTSPKTLAPNEADAAALEGASAGDTTTLNLSADDGGGPINVTTIDVTGGSLGMDGTSMGSENSLWGGGQYWTFSFDQEISFDGFSGENGGNTIFAIRSSAWEGADVDDSAEDWSFNDTSGEFQVNVTDFPSVDFTSAGVANVAAGTSITIEHVGGSSGAEMHDFTIAVPEPSSFALLAGCFGLTWVMLRRRA